MSWTVGGDHLGPGTRLRCDGVVGRNVCLGAHTFRWYAQVMADHPSTTRARR